MSEHEIIQEIDECRDDVCWNMYSAITQALVPWMKSDTSRAEILRALAFCVGSAVEGLCAECIEAAAEHFEDSVQDGLDSIREFVKDAQTPLAGHA